MFENNKNPKELNKNRDNDSSKPSYKPSYNNDQNIVNQGGLSSLFFRQKLVPDVQRPVVSLPVFTQAEVSQKMGKIHLGVGGFISVFIFIFLFSFYSKAHPHQQVNNLIGFGLTILLFIDFFYMAIVFNSDTLWKCLTKIPGVQLDRKKHRRLYYRSNRNPLLYMKIRNYDYKLLRNDLLQLNRPDLTLEIRRVYHAQGNKLYIANLQIFYTLYTGYYYGSNLRRYPKKEVNDEAMIKKFFGGT